MVKKTTNILLIITLASSALYCMEPEKPTFFKTGQAAETAQAGQAMLETVGHFSPEVMQRLNTIERKFGHIQAEGGITFEQYLGPRAAQRYKQFTETQIEDFDHLYKLIRSGKLEEIKKFLRQSGLDIRKSPYRKTTIAIAGNINNVNNPHYLDIIEYLIESGADVNEPVLGAERASLDFMDFRPLDVAQQYLQTVYETNLATEKAGKTVSAADQQLWATLNAVVRLLKQKGAKLGVHL